MGVGWGGGGAWGGGGGWSYQLLCHSQLELRLSWAVTTNEMILNDNVLILVILCGKAYFIQ